MRITSSVTLQNYLTKKFIFLYSIPFLLSILLIFITDPLVVVDKFYQTIFLSVYTFGIPIGIVFLPYYGYFYLLQKYFKLTYVVSITALISTMTGIILVIIFIQNNYRTYENNTYFTKEITNKLSLESVKLFEYETGVQGKVNKIKMNSRYSKNAGGKSTFIEQRSYDIKVVTKNSTDLQKIPRNYRFVNIDNKWILKKKNSSLQD